jgi:tetratricopeptide (TPR) repeat protein
VIRTGAVALAAAIALAVDQPAAPIRGLTAADGVARAYDAVLDGDWESLPSRLDATCSAAPREACQMLEALGVWWGIALEPESRLLDVRFARAVDTAIAATEAWSTREPHRAEAWFYQGAAYGARVQWRVLRGERLAAARDGRRVKESLERALDLDPELHDAKYGIGLYRYYADVAPAALRLLRWLLLLPGGSREDGLRQIEEARTLGRLVRGEADYQLHLIYLWYEQRAADALVLVRSLQTRFPHNPLFYQAEAEIHDVYFHDAAASHAASTALLERVQAGVVHEPALASVRARFNIALQLDRLGRRAEAVAALDRLIQEQPSRPFGITERARRERRRLSSR